MIDATILDYGAEVKRTFAMRKTDSIVIVNELEPRYPVNPRLSQADIIRRARHKLIQLRGDTPIKYELQS